ncbi:putative Cap [Bat cyclovirus GF-4c]|uniref:Putative Cap n=1 Tax=Bat cyclovirus GF-4c TaxID=795381 RepID=D9IZ81_9CIRC|nr:putative Cap [Bat cyclovirus GF-4c]ADI48252.1 putative Cap [Bat cyclovirus GF-4c]
MAAFRRRRRVRPRKNRFGRLRRRRFGRRIGRRKVRPNVLYCKLTRTVTRKIDLRIATGSPNQIEIQELRINLNNFAEHINLASNFEKIKILKQVVSVIPCQNVSNSTTSIQLHYAIVPYKKESPALSTPFPAILSVDKAKMISNTRRASMALVPAAHLHSSGQTSDDMNKLVYKPEFSIPATGVSATIYSGFVAFERNSDEVFENKQAWFVVKQDIYVKYSVQRSFI